MKNRWVRIAIVVGALVVLVIALTPLFVNADTLRPTIENQLSSTLGRPVAFSHLGFSLFTGSLVADNISIADDPAVASSPFLQAKSLHIGVELWPFLLHRSVEITNITIDSPSIQLIEKSDGTWNFSSLGSASATSAASAPAQPSSTSAQGGSAPAQGSSLPAVTVGELAIQHGSASLSLAGPGKPIACSNIDVTVDKFSFTQPFPFKLSVEMPANGSLELNGTAGPVSQTDASKTPFQATLQLKHFDPLAANVVQPSDGVSMAADFSAQVASDGTNLTSTGKIVASQLKLARNGTPAQQPVDIDYTVSHNLAKRTGQVSDIAVHTGAVAAHVKGTFRLTDQGAILDLHLSAPNLPIDAVEQLLPAAGITLPSGSSLKGGTLTANLAIEGPASAITIAGPVEVDNTQLAGFDLGSQIQGINRLLGTSGGTNIEKLSTTLTSSPQTTKFDDIYASVPSIGTASGSGSISPANALDFQLTAKFSSSSTVGSVANSGLNAVGVALGGKANMADKGIPLTITGTASNPSIKAQVGTMLKQQVSSGLLGNIVGQKKTNPAGALKSLFGK
jgi:AsmA protein